ncbi:senecionine N-oxygenase-like isoform X2 [Palaemon carinicauda]|uniref:senecionine N-oxygenase-like isoform X2 n=1 Tax=Palaemon carinicauda TaxID=392227 RepID=UPI0035B5F65F
MKVIGIIGAGASGLCAARHALAAGLTPVVWEQSAELGGTWRLSDEVGVDKFGLPVHSSMYQNLNHFSVPAFPDIPDIKRFKGEKLHSHDYRDPRKYVGRRVLILGAGASGLDICVEVSSAASKVYLAHNFPVLIPSEFPANIIQVPSVKKATDTGFILNNGKSVEVDVILYCTGYEYKFPFLSDSCGIHVENSQVKPLYKHIINAHYPTMGFIGLPSRVVVFPLVYYQVCYFLATLTGETILPPLAEMMSVVEEGLMDLRLKGRNAKEYHRLHTEQWDYMEDLAFRSGLDPPPAFRKKMWGIVIIRLFLSFPLFKTYSYKLADDGTIVESRNGEILSSRWDLTHLAFKQLLRLMWRDFFNVFWLISSVTWQATTKFFKKN